MTQTYLSRPKQPKSQSRLIKQPLLFAILLAFVGGFYLGRHESTPVVFSSIKAKVVELKQRKSGMGSKKEDAQKSSMMELIGLVFKERKKVELTLEREYQQFYSRIFDISRIEDIFLTSEISKARLIRRIMMKILLAQQQQQQPPNSEPITFTWATGGDSAAAGHGNLFNQSYTAILEDTVRASFASVGVTFVGKNYGIGGYGSGPELALCQEAVYGLDLDVLNWDFSMTEQLDPHRAMLWGERAGIHPTKPILFLMDHRETDRWKNFNQLETKGMSTILMDNVRYQILKQRTIPDSIEVANPERALPLPLRYFICNGAVEGGVQCDDPLRNFVCDTEDGGVCKQNKFQTKHVCRDARYQNSWHPGWKDHLLRGRILGYFLLDMLQEALFELDSMRNKDITDDYAVRAEYQRIFDQLWSMEQTDKEAFMASPPFTELWQSNRDTLESVNPLVVFRKNTVCHTALVPAETRFDGILTGTYQKGSYRNYEMGANKALMTTNENGILPLAYDSNDRQQCDALEIDHKEFFFVREGDGWVSTSVPNLIEEQAYGRGEPREGIIMVCLKICPLGRCPEESVGFGYIKRNRGKLFITINDQPVKMIKKLEGCHFLEGEQGLRWGGGIDNEGRYELKFRVEDPGTGHWMKISSIIIF